MHFLGTACGRPTAYRFNASTALELQGRLVMFDCGEPCTALLKKQGLSPGDITDIFITHVHSDHVTGMPMLLREIKKCRKNRESKQELTGPVNIYVPAHANPGLIEGAGVFSGNRREAVVGETAHVHSLGDGVEFVREGFSVTSYANREDDLESYAFLICCAGRRVLHTGDLPGSFAPVADHLNNLDLLITEAAHLPMSAYSVLSEKKIKQIIISHIRWVHHGREDELRKELGEQLGRMNFVLAEDGMEYSL